MFCFTCGSATYSPMFNSKSLSMASSSFGSASLLVAERSAIVAKLWGCFSFSNGSEYVSGSGSK